MASSSPVAPSSLTPDPRPLAPAARWLALLLVIITLAVYGQTVTYEFVHWDDNVHLYDNAELFQPLSWSSLWRIWTQPYANLYVPVSYTFFAAEIAISQALPGPDLFKPVVFHVGCVVLHTLCVLLVFRLLLRLIGHVGAAFVGALIFSLHPLQVESVAWISETRGLLSMLLSLGAVWWYLRAVEEGPWSLVPGPAGNMSHPEPRTKDQGPRTKDQGRFYYLPPSAFRLPPFILATVFFALSLLAKPSAVTLPLIVAAIDYFLVRRDLRKLLLPVGLWCAISLGMTIETKMQQIDGFMTFVTPLWQRPFIAGDSLAFYLCKLVLPVGLGFDYGRTPSSVLSNEWANVRWVYIAWLLPVGTAIAVLAVSRHRATWLAGMAIFVAAVLPVSGVVSFLFQDISGVADRYMYVPMFGVSLAAAGWLARHWSRAMVATCGLLLGMWVSIDMLQIPTWHDNYAMFGHGLKLNPKSFMGQYTLGIVAQKNGDLDEAISRYRLTIAIHPRYFRAYCYMGGALSDQGRLDEAIEAFEAALRLSPNDIESLTGLGNALIKQGKTEDATFVLEGALSRGTYPPTQLALATALMDQGRYQEAIERCYKALELWPHFALARAKLGEVLLKLNEHAEAERQFRIAVEDDPKLAEAWSNLGALEQEAGRYREAIRDFDRAIKLKPTFADPRYNRGVALLQLAEQTNNPETAEQGRQALRETLKLIQPDTRMAELIREHLGEQPEAGSQRSEVGGQKSADKAQEVKGGGD